MRKFLMLSVMAGSALVGMGGGADAAPVAGAFAAAVPLSTHIEAQVETVQYRCGPRCREEARRREWRRRHYARRRHY